VEDHCRAVERLVQREQRAVVEARRQRLQLPVDPEEALALPDERLVERPALDG
jgi:hypothetical protein